ncbi:uncharacterized protein LOC135489733 [Lineus longissimus]|uniref:uncharacterized protein LOC135489733 n=1 Tax=Lineus longissimus TaxID=88925 RepID=UPI00315DDAF4
MAAPGSDISSGETSGSVGNTGMSSFTVDNGSFIETGVSQMATRATFLSMFILTGFLGNCMLVATIAQSKRLRVSMLNLHIISMASVNLVDTTLNMPLVLGSAITQTWDYGGFICQLNSFFVQMVNIAMILSLCMMTMDRFIAVINPDKYKERLNHRNTVIVIIYTWVQAIVFSVPILTGTIPSKAFSARYLCSIAENAPLIYVSIISCFSILVPVFLTIVFFIVIIRSCIRQKVHDRDTLAQNNYTSRAGAEQNIWIELYGARYVGLLCIMWVFLVGPYVTLNYVEQYKNSAETAKLPAFIAFTYAWEVDLSFMWMKLSYVLILPFFTYILRKEVWQKIKDLILCRKSNTITDGAPGNTPPSRQDVEQAKELRLVQVQQNSFSPPILFAIADGLHVIRDNRIQDEMSTEISEVTESTDAMILRAKKCDVNASHEFLRGDEDTSDYDSQCDPYSVSNPISVKDLPEDAKPAFEMTGQPQAKDSAMRVKKESTDEGVGSQETYSSDYPPGNISDDIPVDSGASAPLNNSGNKESWNETSQKEKADSGIDSTQNTNEKDRKRHRRRRTKSCEAEGVTKVEKFEKDEGGRGVGYNEPTDNSVEPVDSGRGTVELKKMKHRKRSETLVPDPVGQNTEQAEPEIVEKTVVERLVEDQGPDNPEAIPKAQPKKKKKRKNKNPLNLIMLPILPPVPPDMPEQPSIDVDDNPGGCKQCQVNQGVEESLSQSKRPPLRLKPLDITHSRKDLKPSQSPVINHVDSKTENALQEANDVLFEKKLIPNITSRTEQNLSPIRRKSGERSVNGSANADSSLIPGQMDLEPESSKKQNDASKLHNSYHSDNVDSLSADQVAQSKTDVPSKYHRSVSENHVRVHSNNDSDTALLSSNTSTDLHEIKQGMMADAVLTGAFPRPKKRKKKRVFMSESSQDLLSVGSTTVQPIM